MALSADSHKHLYATGSEVSSTCSSIHNQRVERGVSTFHEGKLGLLVSLLGLLGFLFGSLQCLEDRFLWLHVL